MVFWKVHLRLSVLLLHIQFFLAISSMLKMFVNVFQQRLFLWVSMVASVVSSPVFFLKNRKYKFIYWSISPKEQKTKVHVLYYSKLQFLTEVEPPEIPNLLAYTTHQVLLSTLIYRKITWDITQHQVLATFTTRPPHVR